MCECVEQRLFEAGELELVRLCNHKINMSIKFNGFFCYYFYFIVYRNLFAWFACSKGPMQTEIKRPTVAATRKGGKHRFTTKHYYFCFARWMGNFHLLSTLRPFSRLSFEGRRRRKETCTVQSFAMRDVYFILRGFSVQFELFVMRHVAVVVVIYGGNTQSINCIWCAHHIVCLTKK